MIKKIAVILCLVIVSGIIAQPKIPEIRRYVNDLTGTLSAREVSGLESSLQQFDNESSTQIVVLMINSLEGYPIEMYAIDAAEKNKIGRKGKDNGILLLIAKADKKMRIEVGYGLEGALPDAMASSIIRNEMSPYFKRGEYYSGIISGLRAIVQTVKGEYVNDRKEDGREKKKGYGFIFYIIMFIVFSLFSRGRGGGLGALLLMGTLGGFGGGRSGGGGGFGGGGASGGW